MKKFTLFTALLLCSFSFLHATIITVRVVDFQFKPKTVNAKLGDTIRWMWKGPSNHTTTSVTIPVGAPAWTNLWMPHIRISDTGFGKLVLINISAHHMAHSVW
jgi:plastocyanin